VAAPDRRRVRQHRGLDARRPRAPLATRTLLVLSVVILGATVFLVASGGIGPALSSLASGFGSAFGRLVATPVPTTTELPPTNAPIIVVPEQPYTNQAQIELSVSVPVEALGDPTAKVRIYLALAGLQAVPYVDVPVTTTSRMTVPVDLTPGRNDFSATLFRGNAESEPSPVVTWILDTAPPKITVTSPRNNAAVDTFEVTIKGKTQAGTSLVALNAANATSISSVAARDGTFEFGLPLAAGANAIQITGTDPAGNVGTTTLKLLQGSTQMVVRLTASTYRISVSKHPASLQLTVLVKDPAGNPLAGASAFFTIQIPGLAPISNQIVTNIDGRAVFATPLVGTLAVGSGIGTVLVTSDLYGQSTDRVTLTFVK
jgi:Glucodextranase, domain B